MDIGLSLPTMARGCDRAATLAWSRAADEGPFSSISCGERITFHNPEMMVTLATAAAVTERVRVFVNLALAPAHPTPELAKQVATLDVMSGGRVDLGVGIGGREHDYLALDSPFDHRHERLDRAVAELRRLWAGGAAFEGADPVEPAPVQPGGPQILAGAMGPKALARAAQWADGITGFSVAGSGAEMAAAADAATQAWDAAGRTEPPRKVTGFFYVLGPDAEATLRSFTAEYLAIFGRSFADAFAQSMTTSTPDTVRAAIEAAESAGCDEVILVPGTPDQACLDATLALF
jgi:alkanesulfonate monooxygenase SsuD/methylene tetrahydromethanopterin reductase-like flavin-dependent oxidoreductase (luciferase family)